MRERKNEDIIVRKLCLCMMLFIREEDTRNEIYVLENPRDRNLMPHNVVDSATLELKNSGNRSDKENRFPKTCVNC